MNRLNSEKKKCYDFKREIGLKDSKILLLQSEIETLLNRNHQDHLATQSEKLQTEEKFSLNEKQWMDKYDVRSYIFLSFRLAVAENKLEDLEKEMQHERDQLSRLNRDLGFVHKQQQDKEAQLNQIKNALEKREAHVLNFDTNIFYIRLLKKKRKYLI